MNLSRIKGVYLRYYYNMMKGPIQLSDLFYWPLIDILLWGLTSIWIGTQSTITNLPLIMMTALIFWQIAMRGSLDISYNILQELWHRNLVNLFSTPLKISEWISGVVLLCILKLVVIISFGAIVVWMLYSLNVFAVGWAFLPFAALILLFGWALGFCAAGLIIFYGQKVEVIAWSIAFLFAPFSAVFYPVHVLPKWAQAISWCLPTTYVFEGMRQLLAGQPFPFAYMCYSLILNFVYLFLAIAFFMWMFEKSRAKGLGRLE